MFVFYFTFQLKRIFLSHFSVVSAFSCISAYSLFSVRVRMRFFNNPKLVSTEKKATAVLLVGSAASLFPLSKKEESRGVEDLRQKLAARGGSRRKGVLGL